jgi:uncharacterized membrane protein YqhA
LPCTPSWRPCSTSCLDRECGMLTSKIGSHMETETATEASPAGEPVPNSWLENAFETVLFQSRFLLLFAVLGSLFASFMMFVKGCLEIVHAATDLFPQVLGAQAATLGDKVVLLSVVPAVDYYLFATALLMFATGIYGIFISKIDPPVRIDSATGKLKRSRLNFRSLDELKTQIGKVVMMLLVVTVFEQSLEIHYGEPRDLLYLGGGLLLVAISLFAAHTMRHPSVMPDHGEPDESEERAS